MKQRLIVRPEAVLDIGDAASWYEREGLGLQFIAELDRVLGRIGEAPTSSRKSSTVSGEGCCTGPHAVYFEVHEEDVDVRAVLHLHRHPDTWKRRD